MTESPTQRNRYKDFLNSLSEGNGFYLECSNGHSSFPPCRVCPNCGDSDISKRSLPQTGTIIAHTVVHVPPPRFDDKSPYIVAIADFGGVKLTGHLRTETVDTVENGDIVSTTINNAASTTERYVEFKLR